MLFLKQLATSTNQHWPLTSEDLVEEDLDVVGCERLRRHDHFVEVALHQFCYHVAGRRLGVKGKKEDCTRTDLHLHRHEASLSTGLVSGCWTRVNKTKTFTNGQPLICSGVLDLDLRLAAKLSELKGGHDEDNQEEKLGQKVWGSKWEAGKGRACWQEERTDNKLKADSDPWLDHMKRIHFLKAVDLWRLQNVQSWQNL